MKPAHLRFAAVSLVLLAVGLFYFSTIRKGFDWGGDFAQYLEHARNLAEGKSYAATNFIYNPAAPIGPPCCPPGFPVLLAPVYKGFGMDMEAMKAETIAFFLLSLALVFILLRRELPLAYGVGLLLFLGFHPYFWGMKDYILSDFPFLCFLMMFLIVLQMTYTKDHWIFPALSGMLLYLCYAVRPVALVLLGVPLLHELVRHRRIGRKSLVVGTVSVLLIAGQHIALKACRAVQFGLLDYHPAQMAKNLYYYGYWLMQLFSGALPAATMVLFIVFSLVAALGFLKRIESMGVLEAFVLLYFVPILLFPNAQGLRYLVPVIPFYFFYFFSGLRGITEYLKSGLRWLPATDRASDAG